MYINKIKTSLETATINGNIIDDVILDVSIDTLLRIVDVLFLVWNNQLCPK
jgi:hypothetical protein